MPILSVLLFAGCEGGGDDGDGDSHQGFSETYVPGESLGGVRLGDTYGQVVTVHGEPTTSVGAEPDRSIFYGDTIMITFRDTDGDGQLSPADTVKSIMGIASHGRGNYMWAGVGIGSTPPEVLARIANPIPDTDYNTIILYNTANDTTLSFIVYQGVVVDVIVSTS